VHRSAPKGFATSTSAPESAGRAPRKARQRAQWPWPTRCAAEATAAEAARPRRAVIIASRAVGMTSASRVHRSERGPTSEEATRRARRRGAPGPRPKTRRRHRRSGANCHAPRVTPRRDAGCPAEAEPGACDQCRKDGSRQRPLKNSGSSVRAAAFSDATKPPTAEAMGGSKCRLDTAGKSLQSIAL
jgi:hypothetical protein